MMLQAFIGLGANLGEPESTLKEAVLRIADIPGIRFVQVSSLYKTEPIDSSGPDYTNAVLEIKTELSSRMLLTQLLAIESDLGRVRPAGVHNAPRTIDLDLLTVGEQRSDDPFVLLPHPRMTERAFVLVPLAEIAPQFNIAGKGQVQAFLASTADQRINRFKSAEEWFGNLGECNGSENGTQAR